MARMDDGTVTVVLETHLGAIDVAISTHSAPITARNFLSHVDNHFYDGGQLHRTVTLENQTAFGAGTIDPSVSIEVIQGGAAPDHARAPLPTIPLERTNHTGIRHLDGTISMSRRSIDSATEQFFICIGDQPALDFGGRRNPDGQGFAAFGRVTNGMDVVRAIHSSPHEGQRLTPPIIIHSIHRG